MPGIGHESPRPTARSGHVTRPATAAPTAAAATRRWRERSFWTEGLEEALVQRPGLSGDLDCDVVIVGAGFTGLWSAYYLKSQRPDGASVRGRRRRPTACWAGAAARQRIVGRLLSTSLRASVARLGAGDGTPIGLAPRLPTEDRGAAKKGTGDADCRGAGGTDRRAGTAADGHQFRPRGEVRR
jgi:hypothetical protein